MSKIKNTLQNRDLQLFYFVNGRVKCKALDRFVPVFTRLGNASTTIVICLVLIFLGSPGLKTVGMEALISLVSSHILVHFLKKLVSRERPNRTLRDVNTFNVPLDYYSFPSGHTTAIFSVCTAFALAAPFLAIPFLLTAFLVGLTRLYLGVHYPSDVLIGMIIGISFSLFIHSTVGPMLLS